MDGHFRAFSFVDAITAVEPGVRIRGLYHIPAQLDEFVRPLAAEAVGQLAAWAAMAAMEFKVRPVAGIASRVELLAQPQPGQTLALSADLESVDEDAVSYSGEATVDGLPVVRLQNCVGPMMKQEEFDDLQAVKDRFALLCGPGAAPGAFDGVPAIEFEKKDGVAGQWVRADLRLPSSAPMFDDHFARRPVFPGTLFMQKAIELASWITAELPDVADHRRWTSRTVSDGKLRAFIPPGDCLEYKAALARREGEAAVVAIEARVKNRVTGVAQITLAPEPAP